MLTLAGLAAVASVSLPKGTLSWRELPYNVASSLFVETALGISLCDIVSRLSLTATAPSTAARYPDFGRTSWRISLKHRTGSAWMARALYTVRAHMAYMYPALSLVLNHLVRLVTNARHFGIVRLLKNLLRTAPALARYHDACHAVTYCLNVTSLSNSRAWARVAFTPAVPRTSP